MQKCFYERVIQKKSTGSSVIGRKWNESSTGPSASLVITDQYNEAEGAEILQMQSQIFLWHL